MLQMSEIFFSKKFTLSDNSKQTKSLRPNSIFSDRMLLNENEKVRSKEGAIITITQCLFNDPAIF